MAAPVAARRFNLGRALEIDVGIVALGVSAMLFAFLTGQEASRWQNLVFAPIAFVLAAACVRLVYAELRELWRADPDTPHRNGAAASAVIPLLVAMFTVPVLLIMPVMFVIGIAG